MVSKEAEKALRLLFWGSFKSYMSNEKSLFSRHINWLTYRTKVKDLYFRMEIRPKNAIFSIDMQMKSESVRDIVLEQFKETKLLLNNFVGNDSEWKKNHISDTGHEIHQISWELNKISFYDIKNHNEIQSFFKEKIKGIDEFWAEYFDLFYALCS